MKHIEDKNGKLEHFLSDDVMPCLEIKKSYLI